MTENPLKAESTAPIIQLIRPFQAFAARETAGGIVLLACTLLALWLANSPWAEAYQHFWHTKLSVSLGDGRFSRDLHFWVNDGLMAIFFFVVGLEIKRELLVGELASPRQAALPIAGALGGVLAPALIFSAMNAGRPGAAGWGIPMATDIAFVIGIMALLGDRVPITLKVFLTALAIVDDLAAVLVIAAFYTASISVAFLACASGCLVLLLLANRLGVRHPLPYALLGILLWYFILQSGVHATIAGVLLAFTIPSRTELNSDQFLLHGRAILDHLQQTLTADKNLINDGNQQMAIEALEDACEKVQPPLHLMEHSLHPWVTFLIMPVFALANAGVTFGGDAFEKLLQPVTTGVMLGLLFGKPLGITLASWLAVKVGLAALPSNVSWRQIHAAGWLGGIGFTMSLFISALALNDDGLLVQAKLGIFAGSLFAAAAGSLLLRR
ncbi:MAG: Na+/H+ antiporter NhaA [Acidobacteria bacterium]|nr:Na+/H+ antiporter NhaA [Acidobacteriota bacterium]